MFAVVNKCLQYVQIMEFSSKQKPTKVGKVMK